MYDEVVHWRKNCFKIPLGNVGKSFVAEMSRLYTAFVATSTLECIALKATVILPILVLQLPNRRSKPKEHAACLERRMKAWKNGDLESLVNEGRTIQLRLPRLKNTQSDSNLARTFANLMFKGKVHAALDLLSNKGRGGVLHLDHLVKSDLSDDLSVKKTKHPVGQPASADCILQGTPPEIHPVVFDGIDARLIRSTALRTTGAAGPSGLDAYSWRRMCTAYKATSSSLCKALADVTKRLCTDYVDPDVVSSLFSCRLLALDKCPGVRPIGIGDTARRIIAKAVLCIAKGDIQGLLSCVQGRYQDVKRLFTLCGSASRMMDVRLPCWWMHSMPSTEYLPCTTSDTLCPTILINSYRASSELFIDGDVLYSQEGTTQGDPLAMPFYALATVPLIKRLTCTVDQTWYADDAAATGKIGNLRKWWDDISSCGPSYGYYANATETWLVTKPGFQSEAAAAFGDTNVNVTYEGRPYLGAALGSSTYVNEFVSGKVQQWSKELNLLSVIVASQPHAAFAAYTHGMISKWSYLSRTIPDIGCHLQALEDIIRCDFLPTLTGRPPLNNIDRKLMALPARVGGLGIVDPSFNSKKEFIASLRVTASLRKLILTQDNEYSNEALADQMTAKSDIHRERREITTQTASSMREELTPTLLKSVDLAAVPASSSWLTSLPIEEHGFCLHKGAFVDALALHYGWAPLKTPTTCVCGANFVVEHLLSCPRGGFPSLRHNEIRDLTTTLLTEVCNDVKVEPDLQDITTETMTRRTANTEDGARLDIVANGFWGGRLERMFLDVRVFKPPRAIQQADQSR